jgi:hypothetical protein
VRFTGPRDDNGALRDGYLTSFVNVSRIEPITTIHDHAAIFDDWVGVLSRLGLHARHIDLRGRLTSWRRDAVEGVTLRFRHAGLDLGDIVLIWNADDPSFLASDLGTGLERLRWVITRQRWADAVFGSSTDAAALAELDSLRTAVLLVGAGVLPTARGPGYATRKILHGVSRLPATVGLSAAVRAAHRFWSLTMTNLLPWPEITRRIESEVLIRG